METIIETEEERAERIQRWRLHQALMEAPDLVAHVRGIAVGGRSERGETLGEWTAPMRISAADDVDLVYAQLVDWVMYAAEELRVAPASATVAAWNVLHATGGTTAVKVHGFRSTATPEGAGLLAKINTVWMLVHQDQLEAWEKYEIFREDVLGILWSLRSRYPLDERRERSTSDRVCPACGAQAVSASWFSESMRDVDVSCAECGFVVEAKTKILDALDWELEEVRACTCRYPGDPLSECPVHHPETSDSETGEQR